MHIIRLYCSSLSGNCWHFAIVCMIFVSYCKATAFTGNLNGFNLLKFNHYLYCMPTLFFKESSIKKTLGACRQNTLNIKAMVHLSPCYFSVFHCFSCNCVLNCMSSILFCCVQVC